MPSKILYDSRDNQIKRCQPEPHGSASLPSKKALCRSARIPEDEKEYMATCIITEDMLTKEAVKTLRIIEGEAILKPKTEITTDKTTVDTSLNETFTLTVTITDILENENFSDVVINIEDAEITIDLTDNTGSQEIELTDPDKYTITCLNPDFRSNTVTVEGI